jgi:plasmid stability protein
VKNITVALDDETYRQARIRAAERNTSVSAMVKQLLLIQASAERELDFAPTFAPDERKSQFLDLAEQLRALSAGRKHTPAEALQREGRDER